MEFANGWGVSHIYGKCSSLLKEKLHYRSVNVFMEQTTVECEHVEGKILGPSVVKYE
jgi:hypothetical protein